MDFTGQSEIVDDNGRPVKTEIVRTLTIGPVELDAATLAWLDRAGRPEDVDS